MIGAQLLYFCNNVNFDSFDVILFFLFIDILVNKKTIFNMYFSISFLGDKSIRFNNNNIMRCKMSGNSDSYIS